MKLPNNLRNQLKVPLGILLPDNQVNKENVSQYIGTNSFIITVGDATTEKILKLGITPSLQIIDNFEKRTKRNTLALDIAARVVSCNNPAGEITNESITAIKNAFKSKIPVRIIITGEEDLLVIPVCIFAPNNSVVMYGQPNEGLVIVQIDDKIRKKTQLILDSMN